MSQKRCKECNVKILGYNPPDLCNKCNPMQNKEEEWEKQAEELGHRFSQEDLIFISQEIEKSYEKGKEETLEEVEKVIISASPFKFTLGTGTGDGRLSTEEFKLNLLQQLNKMKEYERHN